MADTDPVQDLIEALYQCSMQLALRGGDLDAVYAANKALRPYHRAWLRFDDEEAGDDV